MLSKMKKLNGESLSVRNKETNTCKLLRSSNDFMSSTQTGFRNISMVISSTACSQLIDAQQEQKVVTGNQENYIGIPLQLQEV
jgi:hypothetical protein